MVAKTAAVPAPAAAPAGPITAAPGMLPLSAWASKAMISSSPALPGVSTLTAASTEDWPAPKPMRLRRRRLPSSILTNWPVTKTDPGVIDELGMARKAFKPRAAIFTVNSVASASDTSRPIWISSAVWLPLSAPRLILAKMLAFCLTSSALAAKL